VMAAFHARDPERARLLAQHLRGRGNGMQCAKSEMGSSAGCERTCTSD